MQRISAGIPQFQATFGKVVTLEHTSWAGNTLTLTVGAMGIRTSGTTVVTENSAKLEANLPLLFVPFAGRVEGLIKRHGAELLAGPPAQQKLEPALRAEIHREAKAAAHAAGLDWSQLSREERRSFGLKARGQS